MSPLSPFRSWEKIGKWEVPPSPQPLNSLTGAAFAKVLCKILSRKDLAVTILTIKNLLAFAPAGTRPLTP